MLKNEREREIINILKEKDGFVTVRELCSMLYASESSIRRDLSSLEEKGAVARTYGGAELITGHSGVIAFSQRTHQNVDAKRIIAQKAVKLIKDGSIIFLDQSSTAFYLANEIPPKSSVTVITNNIEIISLLSATNIKTVSSGGTLSGENRACLIGSDAHYIFENTYADFLFFSARSLADDGTISDCTREEVAIRNTMLKSAERKVFLCDSEKFGTHSSYKQCSLSDVDVLVSENETAQKYRAVSGKAIIL